MIHHPYGASSSYMYASEDSEQHGSDDYSDYPRNLPPQRFESFMPRFSTESGSRLSQSGATENTNGIVGTRNVYSFNESSLYPPISLSRRIWRTLKGLGCAAKRRFSYPFRNFVFVRPCHYNIDNDSGFFL